MFGRIKKLTSKMFMTRDKKRRHAKLLDEQAKTKRANMLKHAIENGKRREKRNDMRKKIASSHAVNWRRVVLMGSKGNLAERYVIKSRHGANFKSWA